MWIKICGIQDIDTATAVASFGPNAIGLNFYTGTPRCVPTDVAALVVASLPAEVEPVALFVNHPVAEIVNTCRQIGVRTVQLHGDESPRFLAELQHADETMKIVRALRCGAEGLEPLDAYLAECLSLGFTPAACLLDAKVAGVFGGSGTQLPWEDLQGNWSDDRPRLILAGGLNPDNVADAIRTVRPWGVDVSSGVESSPGVKDLGKVEQFIRAARAAFAEIGAADVSRL